MSSNRPRLTRRTASRWLDHPREHAGDPLGAVLSAAAAASRETDAAAEERAVAQFRSAAPLVPVVGALGAPLMTRLKKKIVAAPVAATGIAGLVLAGGVAVAASAGVIDVPFDGHDNRSDKAPDAPSSTNPGLDRTDGPTPGGPGASPTGGANPDGSPQGSPTPSLDGLCKAFQAGAYKDDKKSPAFGALAAAAGGAENVATYCVDRIGERPSRPAKPTQAAQPTKPAKPTQAAQPTQPPQPTQAAQPTQKPTQAGKPTDKGKPVTG